MTGTSCADCTVKVYKSTGAVGAAGPGQHADRHRHGHRQPARSRYAPSGALAVSNIVTASSTSPLAVTGAYAANVKSK